MIMLIGLPAAGKTTWANKHATENLEKRFNIIGTSQLIDRMKVCIILCFDKVLTCPQDGACSDCLFHFYLKILEKNRFRHV